MQRPIYLLKPSVSRARLATLRKQTWGSLLFGVLTTTLSWWFPNVGLGLIIATFIFWTVAVPVGDNA
jgi:asparagine N-glycosylation enzyme membrane subunit Stt3